ncbi:MAG: hypothetical protein Q4D73_02460 [Actinomycetaceae bacterium]|nr:hypothetical protein [Actinomycetaceae bacterium]
MQTKPQPSVWQLTKVGLDQYRKFLLIPVTIFVINTFVSMIVRTFDVGAQTSTLTETWAPTALISVLAIHTPMYLMTPKLIALAGAPEKLSKLALRLIGLGLIAFNLLLWGMLFAVEYLANIQGAHWNLKLLLITLAGFFIADQAAYTIASIYLKQSSNIQVAVWIIVYSMLLAAAIASLVVLAVFELTGYVFGFEALLLVVPGAFLVLSALLSLNTPLLRRA